MLNPSNMWSIWEKYGHKRFYVGDNKYIDMITNWNNLTAEEWQEVKDVLGIDKLDAEAKEIMELFSQDNEEFHTAIMEQCMYLND